MWETILASLIASGAQQGFSSLLGGKQKSTSTQPIQAPQMGQPDVLQHLMQMMQQKKGGF